MRPRLTFFTLIASVQLISCGAETGGKIVSFQSYWEDSSVPPGSCVRYHQTEYNRTTGALVNTSACLNSNTTSDQSSTSTTMTATDRATLDQKLDALNLAKPPNPGANLAEASDGSSVRLLFRTSKEITHTITIDTADYTSLPEEWQYFWLKSLSMNFP